MKRNKVLILLTLIICMFMTGCISIEVNKFENSSNETNDVIDNETIDILDKNNKIINTNFKKDTIEELKKRKIIDKKIKLIEEYKEFNDSSSIIHQIYENKNKELIKISFYDERKYGDEYILASVHMNKASKINDDEFKEFIISNVSEWERYYIFSDYSTTREDKYYTNSYDTISILYIKKLDGTYSFVNQEEYYQYMIDIGEY